MLNILIYSNNQITVLYLPSMNKTKENKSKLKNKISYQQRNQEFEVQVPHSFSSIIGNINRQGDRMRTDVST